MAKKGPRGRDEARRADKKAFRQTRRALVAGGASKKGARKAVRKAKRGKLTEERAAALSEKTGVQTQALLAESQARAGLGLHAGLNPRQRELARAAIAKGRVGQLGRGMQRRIGAAAASGKYDQQIATLGGSAGELSQFAGLAFQRRKQARAQRLTPGAFGGFGGSTPYVMP